MTEFVIFVALTALWLLAAVLALVRREERPSPRARLSRKWMIHDCVVEDNGGLGPVLQRDHGAARPSTTQEGGGRVIEKRAERPTLTPEQQRRIRKAAEKFRADLAKDGMTLEGVTEHERGVPTIHIHIGKGGDRQDTT